MLNNQYEYQVGGSLRFDAPSYVQRPADKQLYQALKDGDFCYVLNSRQMGKSSLRVRTMQRLKTEGFHCISLDMTRLGSEHLTPKQWYERVISELWRGANLIGKLNLKAWFQQHQDSTYVQLLDDFIEEVLLKQLSQEKIIIFIDEIDSVLSLNFGINDFFALIRACYNHRVDNPEYNRLTFCLLGVATPSDLITDKTRTPFNIGKAISLDGFQFKEAQILAQGLTGKVSDTTGTLKEVLYWTGGQPFMTQKLCQLVINNASLFQQNNKTKVGESIKKLVHTQMIENWETQDEPAHFRTIRDRLLRDEKKASRLLGLYQQILQKGEIPADDSEGQMELRLSGLVVKHNSSLKAYNPIDAAIFNQQWVDITLNNLRPYAESFKAWIASQKQDQSRLLRGQALEEALQWSTGRNLSLADVDFLQISQQFENRETKKANKILANANRKAKQRLKWASGLLGTVIIVASLISIWANNSISRVRKVQRELAITEVNLTSANALQELQNGKQQEAMILAIQAASELKKMLSINPRKYTTNNPVEPQNRKYTTSNPIVALQKALDHVQVLNLWGSGEISVQFTPQENYITHSSTIYDNKLTGVNQSFNFAKILDIQGEEIITIKSKRQSEDQDLYSMTIISPDNQYFLMNEPKGYTKSWNFEGQPLREFKKRYSSFSNIEFSSDGNIIYISDSSSCEIQVLNKKGEQLADVSYEDNLTNCVVRSSPNGEHLLQISEDNRSRQQRWSLWTFKEEKIANFNSNLKRRNMLGSRNRNWRWLTTVGDQNTRADEVQFSADGQNIITVDQENKTIKIWDLKGEQIAAYLLPIDTIEAASLESDTKQLVTIGKDGKITLWTVQGQKIIEFSALDQKEVSELKDLEFSPDGQFIAVFAKDIIKIWNRQGKLMNALRNKKLGREIQFSPDSNIILLDKGNKPSLWYWQGKQLATFKEQQGEVWELQMTPDGKHIVTLGEGNLVQVWNIKGDLVSEFNVRDNRVYRNMSEGNRLRLSPKGDRILINASGTTQVWDLQGNKLAEVEGGWGQNWVTPMSYDSRYIMAGNAIKDLETNQVSAYLKEEGTFAHTLHFSPKGDLIATAGGYGMVHLWNFKGEKVKSFQAHPSWINHVYFSKEGDRLLTMVNLEFKLWDLQGNLINERPEVYVGDLGNKEIYKIPGFGIWSDRSVDVYSNDVQMSTDGKRIATFENNNLESNKIKVWDANGNQLAEYDGIAMALHPSGKQIVVVSPDDNIPRLWPVDDLDGLLQRGCEWLKPYFVIRDHLSEEHQICKSSTMKK